MKQAPECQRQILFLRLIAEKGGNLLQNDGKPAASGQNFLLRRRAK